MLGAYCWLLQLVLVGGGLHSLGSPQTGLKSLLGGTFPSHVAPSLAPEALEGTWVLPAGGAFFGLLGVWSLASTSSGPCAIANRGAVG